MVRRRFDGTGMNRGHGALDLVNVTLCPQREARKTLTTTFEDLGAAPEIVEALEAAGIRSPFPIQEMAIPIALSSTDVIAQARTGTGKTLAFGIPVLQHVRDDLAHTESDAPTTVSTAPRALVITPTRELAIQVADDLNTAASRLGTRILTVYGGVSYETQLSTLQDGVDVVVGTPGRLLDLVDRNALQLGQVRSLVLDEADRMLDLGFLPDVEKLLSHTHEERRTLLFSATMPADIMQLARRHMRQPVNVRAESSSESQTVPATTQFVYRAHDLDKPEVLARVLQADTRERAIIFCTTKRQAQRVSDDLADRGFSVAAIHGDLGQEQRERALARFRDNRIEILVATDVAARGLDVEGVTHVVNYTCPDDEKTYVHRIGRTGRAGASGIAVTFVDWPDTARWKMINKALTLDFAEPVETYSTSSHLFDDLGISTEATGRVGKPTGQQTNERDQAQRGEGGSDRKRPGRSRNRRRSGSGTEGTSRPDGRPPEEQAGGRTEERSERRRSRNRSRRRLRGGVPVESNADAGTDGLRDAGDRKLADTADVVTASGPAAPTTQTARIQPGSGPAPIFQAPALPASAAAVEDTSGAGDVSAEGVEPSGSRRRRRTRRRTTE